MRPLTPLLWAYRILDVVPVQLSGRVITGVGDETGVGVVGAVGATGEGTGDGATGTSPSATKNTRGGGILTLQKTRFEQVGHNECYSS